MVVIFLPCKICRKRFDQTPRCGHFFAVIDKIVGKGVGGILDWFDLLPSHVQISVGCFSFTTSRVVPVSVIVITIRFLRVLRIIQCIFPPRTQLQGSTRGITRWNHLRDLPCEDWRCSRTAGCGAALSHPYPSLSLFSYSTIHLSSQTPATLELLQHGRSSSFAYCRQSRYSLPNQPFLCNFAIGLQNYIIRHLHNDKQDFRKRHQRKFAVFSYRTYNRAASIGQNHTYLQYDPQPAIFLFGNTQSQTTYHSIT